jgi:hypothetical protein
LLLRVLAVCDDLGSVLLPELGPAHVVLVRVAEDDVGDRARRQRLAEQAPLLGSLGGEARIEDHVSRIGRHDLRVRHAASLIHDVVELADLDRDLDEVGGVTARRVLGDVGSGDVSGHLGGSKVDGAPGVTGEEQHPTREYEECQGAEGEVAETEARAGHGGTSWQGSQFNTYVLNPQHGAARFAPSARRCAVRAGRSYRPLPRESPGSRSTIRPASGWRMRPMPASLRRLRIRGQPSQAVDALGGARVAREKGELEAFPHPRFESGEQLGEVIG